MLNIKKRYSMKKGGGRKKCKLASLKLQKNRHHHHHMILFENTCFTVKVLMININLLCDLDYAMNGKEEQAKKFTKQNRTTLIKYQQDRL